MKTRPRLASHALVRRHLVDGEEKVVVHHAATGALVVLTPRAAELALLGDGTRDLDALSLAASARGLYRREREISELFEALEAHGLVDDGVDPRGGDRAPGPRLDAPVRVLAGYAFRCDGGGACCRQYASIALDRGDVLAALGARPTALPGDGEARRLFLPIAGARADRYAMTMVDGRCLQLDPSARCSLHERGGPGAKPKACRLYPATFTDDGEAIRVSCSTECDCVFASLEGEGEPLVESSVSFGRDLPGSIRVRSLPDRVPLSPRRAVEREEAVRLLDEIAAAPSDRDAVTRCFDAAAEIDPDEERDGRAASMRRAVEQLHAAMRSATEAAAAWRSSRDRTRLLRTAVRDASGAVLKRGVDSVGGVGGMDRDERFTLRASLFGLFFAGGVATTSEALRELGAKILVARELELSGSRSLGHPIAVVCAAARGAS